MAAKNFCVIIGLIFFRVFLEMKILGLSGVYWGALVKGCRGGRWGWIFEVEFWPVAV